MSSEDFVGSTFDIDLGDYESDILQVDISTSVAHVVPPTYDVSYTLGMFNYGIMSDASLAGCVSNWYDLSTATIPAVGNAEHISNWDVSAVTNMSNLFKDKSYFNDDISGWNVSNVTTMSNMFSNDNSFNQPIGSWNVGKVQSFGLMFNGAYTFNQDISDWNTVSAENMAQMFMQTCIYAQTGPALGGRHAGDVH